MYFANSSLRLGTRGSSSVAFIEGSYAIRGDGSRFVAEPNEDAPRLTSIMARNYFNFRLAGLRLIELPLISGSALYLRARS